MSAYTRLVLPVSTQTLRESVISGAFWVGIERWANQILSLSVYVVLARLVGPTSFGIFALAGVYLAFIEIFAKQGFGTALIQRNDLQDAHLDSAFWLNLFAATSLALASIFSAGQLAILFGEQRLTEILRWLSAALVLKGVSAIPQSMLEREMAFRTLAIRTLLATLVGGVVGLGMAWLGLGIWSLVGQQLSSAITGAAVLWWATSWRPSFHISRTHLRDLYGFSINIIGNDLLWLGSQRADQLVIGVRLGASLLGPYALAVRLLELLIDLVTAPIAVVALPAFSRLQNERQRLQEAFYKTTEAVATVSIPAFCGISVLAPSVIPLFFGTQWSPSVPLIQILSIFGILRATLCCGHPLMLAIGRPGIYFLLFAFYSGLTTVLCFIAAGWSLFAVASGVSLAMCIYSVVFLLVCHRLVGISTWTLIYRLHAPVIASGVMIAAVSAIQYLGLETMGDLLFIITTIPVAISVYIVTIMMLRPQLWEELSQAFCQRLKIRSQN